MGLTIFTNSHNTVFLDIYIIKSIKIECTFRLSDFYFR